MLHQHYKVLSCPIQEGQEKPSLSADGTHLEQKQIMLEDGSHSNCLVRVRAE